MEIDETSDNANSGFIATELGVETVAFKMTGRNVGGKAKLASPRSGIAFV